MSYHGDFDGRGVEICCWLQQQADVVPWRMTEQAYRAAPGGGQLEGRPATSPWEPSLAAAMAERGVAVHEEQVIESLLDSWLDEDQGRHRSRRRHRVLCRATGPLVLRPACVASRALPRRPICVRPPDLRCAAPCVSPARQ
jgi:hypothetical protein